MQPQPTCKSCHKVLEMAWPDTPWDCNVCGAALCIGCYVEHTDRKHFRQLYPEVAKKLDEEEKKKAAAG